MQKAASRIGNEAVANSVMCLMAVRLTVAKVSHSRRSPCTRHNSAQNVVQPSHDRNDAKSLEFDLLCNIQERTVGKSHSVPNGFGGKSASARA